MQRYLKGQTKGDITLGALSEVSCYSPWHSSRLFKEALGIAPVAYLRRLRLSESALLLRDEKRSILDVALRYGYRSVDGYQRSFKKEFGINPPELMPKTLPPSPYLSLTTSKYPKKGNRLGKRKTSSSVSLKSQSVSCCTNQEAKAKTIIGNTLAPSAAISGESSSASNPWANRSAFIFRKASKSKVNLPMSKGWKNLSIIRGRSPQASKNGFSRLPFFSFSKVSPSKRKSIKKPSSPLKRRSMLTTRNRSAIERRARAFGSHWSRGGSGVISN